MLDGLHPSGRAVVGGGRGPAAKLWRSIWTIWLDRDGMDEPTWVRAHVSQGDLLKGKADAWQSACNDHADVFAKRGADIDDHSRPGAASSGRL